MHRRYNVFLFGITASMCIAFNTACVMAGGEAGEFKAYEPTWESLTTHPIPEWFKDAKFGIYAHLGPYCVPAFGNEWYPRRMYRPGDKRSADPAPVYDHHRKTYGDPAKFGYKDFFPMFTMDKFDPAAWAQLYKDAGARFAGPVAEHHDGFSMWASEVNRWNAKAMGPRRDVAGELIREIRKRDMKVVASFHHAHNHNTGYFAVDEAAAKKKGWDVVDPKFGDLYGRYPSREKSMEVWFEKIKEVIDAYQPDQVWFDFGLSKIPDADKQRMAAYYYNKQNEWGKAVIITRKGEHLPPGVGVLDIERGRMKGMGERLWQTDDSTAYNSWSYVEGLKVKPTRELVHELIDIVSKNGVLLLNVCPAADGTISADQQALLRGIGAWLKVNGEAIYGTRPWATYGEGPTHTLKGGGFIKMEQMTDRDIRYTRSKDGKTLYAIVMGWRSGPVTLTLPKIVSASPSAKVELLGHTGTLPYQVDAANRITAEAPDLRAHDRPCEHAFTLKLSGFEIGVQPDAAFLGAGTVTLPANKATLAGRLIQLEEQAGRPNIGHWDHAQDAAHWLAYIPEPGTYLVRGEFATVHPKSHATLSVDGQHTTFTVTDTKGWDKPTFTRASELTFKKAGVHHIVMRPTKGKRWAPINVWQVQLVLKPVTE